MRSWIALALTAFLIWWLYDSYTYDKDMDAFEKQDRILTYGKN